MTKAEKLKKKKVSRYRSKGGKASIRREYDALPQIGSLKDRFTDDMNGVETKKETP